MKNYFEYIFSRDTCQQLSILEILFNSQRGANIEMLIKSIGADRRIVLRHLKYIDNIASELEIDKLKVHPKSRERLFLGNKLEYYRLRISLMKKEPMLTFIELFLDNKSVNLTSFCKENFISESTFRRKLQSANILLKLADSKFVVRKNRIYLLGEERIIRYALISFLWRVYRGIEWPFKGVDEKQVDKIISLIIPSKKYLNAGKRKHFAFYFAVFVSRAQSENIISEKLLPKYAKALISNSYYKEKITRIINKELTLPQVELEFMLLIFYIFPECYEEFQGIDNTLDILKKYSRRSYISIIHFVSFMKKRHPKWNDKQPKNALFWPAMISARIFVDIFKLTYFNTSAVRIYSHVTVDYPNLLPTIKKNILSHEPRLPKNTVKSLTLRYGQAYVMEFSPQDFEIEITILLLTDGAAYIDEITINRIQNLLKNRFNIKLLVGETNVVPDLILATDMVDLRYPHIKKLYINPEISLKDTENIFRACDNIKKKKKEMI
ncbi:helix-turn-helix domain-containing protein [Lactococcus petauri]|uniref:helix-turn-helix domain-containing protein n=1 Tax=Lactococcus petauri TaxID=1940789 RepID=UPI0030D3F5C1